MQLRFRTKRYDWAGVGLGLWLGLGLDPGFRVNAIRTGYAHDDAISGPMHPMHPIH